MRAAGFFLNNLGRDQANVHRIRATAYGSLAWTGKGHATDSALVLGLSGERPEQIDPESIAPKLAAIAARHQLTLPSGHVVRFDPAADIVLDTTMSFSRHPNALRFEAFDAGGRSLREEIWYSVGGWFVEQEGAAVPDDDAHDIPFAFENATALLAMSRHAKLSIADVVLISRCREIQHTNRPLWRDCNPRIAGVIRSMRYGLEAVIRSPTACAASTGAD